MIGVKMCSKKRNIINTGELYYTFKKYNNYVVTSIVDRINAVIVSAVHVCNGHTQANTSEPHNSVPMPDAIPKCMLRSTKII